MKSSGLVKNHKLTFIIKLVNLYRKLYHLTSKRTIRSKTSRIIFFSVVIQLSQTPGKWQETKRPASVIFNLKIFL